MPLAIKRIPNHYGSSTAVLAKAAMPNIVVDNDEFASFVSGSKELTPALQTQLNKALTQSDARLKIFLSAYMQKGMGRLVSIMQGLDKTEESLMQEWRIKCADTDTLIDLFAELNDEKHATVKELLEITTKFGTTVGEDQVREQPAEDLTAESRKRVIRFFKDKVAK